VSSVIACLQVKNIRPGFKWGFWTGLVNAAVETYVYPLLFGGPLWTVPHNVPDHQATRPAASCKQIDYPACGALHHAVYRCRPLSFNA
jgi:hypothetical protein